MSNQQRRRVVVVLAAVAFAVATPLRPAAAQTSTNNAGIEGRVADESGGALPGVAVTHRERRAAGARKWRRSPTRPAATASPPCPAANTPSPSRSPASAPMVRQGLKLGSGFVATVDMQAGARPGRRDADRRRRIAARRRPHHDRGHEHQERADGDDSDVARLRRRRQARARRPPLGPAGRRRQPDRRPARQSRELRIERRRPDADARRHQHRRHRRLLRLRRHRGNDRAARRQRRRDPDLGHGVPDHHQVGWQRLPRRRPGRLAGENSSRATTSTTSCGQGRHRRQPDGALLRPQRLAGRPHHPRPAVVLRQRRGARSTRQEVLGYSGAPGPDGVYFTPTTSRDSRPIGRATASASSRASRRSSTACRG